MEQTKKMSEQYDVIVGWDWADQKHDVYHYESASDKYTYEQISSTPNAVDEWISKFSSGKIAIAIELKRGAVISMLLKHGNIDIYPIKTTCVSNYRKAFSPSGSKNDKGDAYLLLNLILTHSEKFKKLEPDTADVRELDSLNELRRQTVDEKKSLINELTSRLKSFYPQAIELVDRLDSEVGCAMLMKWPSFDKIQASNGQTIRKFFYKHNLRSEKCLQEKLELIKSSSPLTMDRAIINPLVMRVKTIITQIRALNNSIKEFDEKIDKIYTSLDDRKIFDSLPGAGKVMAPRIFCVFGSKRSNYESALEVSTLTGVAPVTESSGKKEWVHWRWNAPSFMRQSLVEFAGQSVIYSKWAKIYYNGMKLKGKGRNAILRTLAFKWVRIITRCWKDGVKYDEQRYIDSLIKSGSWIGKELKNAC